MIDRFLSFGLIFLFCLVGVLAFNFGDSTTVGNSVYIINGSEVSHNDLFGLQGGQSGEYYHLTASEYSNLDNYLVNGSSASFQDLTVEGVLIVNELSQGDLIPASDNLYNVGNSSNKWKNIYAYNIYATNMNVTNVVASSIESDSINSNSVNSSVVSSVNLKSDNANFSNNISIGSFAVKNEGGNMVVMLG